MACSFSWLGDDPGLAAVGRYAVADEVDVFRGADEGDGDCVNAGAQGEFEVDIVFFGERRDADGDAGEVDALVFAEFAAVDDFADDVSAVDFVDAKLDEAVGEQDARALLHIFREGLEGGADDWQQGSLRLRAG